MKMNVAVIMRDEITQKISDIPFKIVQPLTPPIIYPSPDARRTPAQETPLSKRSRKILRLRSFSVSCLGFMIVSVHSMGSTYSLSVAGISDTEDSNLFHHRHAGCRSSLDDRTHSVWETETCSCSLLHLKDSSMKGSEPLLKL